jgi:hypothetical protein
MPFTPTPVGDVTPNAGRTVWNANDAGIAGVANGAEATASQAAADLAAHKQSADHDARYYTETEIDAQRSAHNASGDHDGRYYTEAEIDAQRSAHNASGDHDGRYYTEAEIDAQRSAHNASGDHDARYAQLNGNQTLGGTKTFSSDIRVVSGVEMRDARGYELARVRGAIASDVPIAKFEIFEGGSFVTFMQAIANGNAVHFDRPLIDGPTGSPYATRSYIDRRVRSSTSLITGQTDVLAIAASGYTKVGSANQVIVLPPGARVTTIVVAPIDPSLQGTQVIDVPFIEITTCISVELVNNSGEKQALVRLRSPQGTGQLTWFTGNFTGAGAAAAYAVTLVTTI